MLKQGKHNKKLGDVVTKKMWNSHKIYSLTLEERATCPTNCEQWNTCYGNNMPFGHRFDHTHPDFLQMLDRQLGSLNALHPKGFVMRLHVLGDFFSIPYVQFWVAAIEKYKALKVFGYTHHKSFSAIGKTISNTNTYHPKQFRIRFSDDTTTEFSAHVLPKNQQTLDKHTSGIICPEQLNKTDSCATCTYCWSSDKPVHFIEH